MKTRLGERKKTRRKKKDWFLRVRGGRPTPAEKLGLLGGGGGGKKPTGAKGINPAQSVGQGAKHGQMSKKGGTERELPQRWTSTGDGGSSKK